MVRNRQQPRVPQANHETGEPHRRTASAPITPDGRYFVVRGRLWRRTNPALPDADRNALVRELMAARRAVRAALSRSDAAAEAAARAAVDAAKRGLGERGPVWWTDGAPDYNRRMVGGTPYAGWYAELTDAAVLEDELAGAEHDGGERGCLGRE